MAFYDDFQAQRAQILGGGASNPSSFSTQGNVFQGGIDDFEKRRRELLQQSASQDAAKAQQKKQQTLSAVTTPVQSKQPNFFQDAIDTITNTAKDAIMKLSGQQPPQTPQQKLQTQYNNAGVLLPGQTPPVQQNIQQYQAQLKQTQTQQAQVNNPINQFAAKAANVIDTAFKNAPNVIISPGVKSAVGAITNPDQAIGQAQKFLAKPENQNITKPLAFVQTKIVEPVFESNPVLRGIQKGVAETFLGNSQKVMDIFNKPIDKPITTQNQVLSTIGDVTGQTLSFLAGGEITKGIGLGKAALPVLFTALGQTSAPANTTVLQRLEKAPVDAVAGWLLSKVPAARKLISSEALKQVGISAGVLSGNTFVNSLIQGLPPKEAAKAAAQMAVVAGLFHIGGTATGLITNKVLGSKYQSGNIEMTPSDARTQVQATDLNGTPAGDMILKAADQAEKTGKNLNISGNAAQKSKVAALFNAKTPNGIAFNVDLVEPTKIQLLKEEGIAKAAEPTSEVNPQEPTQTEGKTASGVPIPKNMTKAYRDAIPSQQNKSDIEEEKSSVANTTQLTPEYEAQRKTPFDTKAVIDERNRQATLQQTNEIKTPEREAMRQSIADTLYKQGGYHDIKDRPTTVVNHDKRADIVMGPPAAGKSTVFSDPLVKQHGSILIDSDEAKKGIIANTPGANANSTHTESTDIGNRRLIQKAVGDSANVVIPLVGKNIDNVRAIRDSLREAGYDVHLHFNDVPREVAAQRALKRFEDTGRFVDPHYVYNEVGLHPSRNYDILKHEKEFASYEKYSNNVPEGSKPKLIESSNTGRDIGKRPTQGNTTSQSGKEKSTSETKIATESYTDKSTRIIDTLNPTGSVFSKYAAKERASFPLGKNITTLAETSNKNPDEMVSIYRGVSKNHNTINPGDFITTDLNLAKSYSGNGKILSKKVRLGDILDDKTEPLGGEYIYRPQTETPGYTGGTKGAAAGDFSNLRNLSRDAGYVQPLEFPEVVRMAKELTGKYPEVWKKLRNKLADTQEETLRVRLKADIFKDTLTASKVLSHELGHVADYLPEGLRRKGGLISHIATLNGAMDKYLREFPESIDNVITKQDKARLMEEAKTIASQKIDNRVQIATKDIKPAEILAIWNDGTGGITNPDLLDYIKSLDEKQKKDIALQAMRGKVADWVTFQHKEYGTVTSQALKSSPKSVQAEYKRLLQEEIIKRRLHDIAAITKELKTLSQKWRPFDPAKSDKQYIAYRNQSDELYADAISVLFNDPVRLQQEAPKFWSSFFNYIDQKPPVAKAFFDTYEMLNRGKDTVVSERRKVINEAFATGEQKWAALRTEEKEKKESYAFQFKYDFIDKNQRLLDIKKKAIKEGKPVNDIWDPEYLLNGRNYLSGRIKYMLEAKVTPIYDTIKKAGMTDKNFDELLLLQRIINAPERAEIANPYGLDKTTAADTLEGLKKELGDTKFNLLDKSARDFRNVMKSYIDEAFNAGMYTKEMYTQMKDNPAYATFAVLDYLNEYISAHIYQGVGTVKEVASPATATVMKTLSTIRAIEHQKAKLGIFEFLKNVAPDELKEAETRFDGKVMAPIESKDPNLKLVTYLKDGKLAGVYVDKYIASSINYETPDRLNLGLRVLKQLQHGILQPVFITFNPGFQSFNFLRDFKRFIKNYPSKSIIKSAIVATEYYAKALPASAARGFGKQNALIQQMEEKKILGITYNDILAGKTAEDSQLEYLMQKYDAMRKGDKRPIYLRPFLSVLQFIENVGNTIETLPKVAGYMALEGKMPANELHNFIRSYLGSPDFLKGGKQKSWSNTMFMFSNAIAQGIRADYTIGTIPKTRIGYWWKTAMLDLLPKVLMFAAVAGFLGKELKDEFDNVSEYDKTNYIIVPMGWENNKVRYLRIPHDDTGRFIAGLVWKSLQTATGQQKTDAQESLFQLLSYAGGQFPSISPVLSTIQATGQFLAGQNPYDFYRGRTVIPDKIFQAGGLDKDKTFAMWLFQSLGGNVVLGTSVSEQTSGPKGWLENLVGQPLLSNIIGRWVKVSNYGVTEENKNIHGMFQQQSAQKSLQNDQIISNALEQYKKTDKTQGDRIAVEKQMVEQSLGKLTKDNVADARLLIKKFKVGIVKGYNDPNTNAIISAVSQDEKVYIMQKVQSEYSNTDYVKFRTSLIKEGLLSIPVQKQMKKAGL